MAHTLSSTVRIAALVALAVGAGWPVQAQTSCGRGPVTLAVEVVDGDGNPIPEALLRIGDRCLAPTDADGRLEVSGLSPARALIRPAFYLVCIEPVWIQPTEPRVELRLVGTLLPNPLDDRQFTVHGWPYVPPTYEQFRCVAENGEPLEPGAGALVPTPDEALGWALNHASAAEVLQIAAGEHDIVPLLFHYGPLAASPPAAPIPYAEGRDRSGGFLYVIVLRASHQRLALQMGYHRGRDEGLRRTYVEDGLRLEWLRGPEGWDEARVVERWEAPPASR